MKSVLARIPAFRLGRALGTPFVLPASLTISVLYACNARCKTCHVYETKSKLVTLDEYRALFASVGTAPRWVTVSGGEPLLRKDLGDILVALAHTCRPAVINLPTNGTFPDRVAEVIARATAEAPRTSFVVNVSLDDIGRRHDVLRGFDDNYELALQTLAGLKRLKASRNNLTVGVHSVISKHNEEHFPEIADALIALEPDSYIAEVAEERVELRTTGKPIGPTKEGLLRAIAHLRKRARRGTTLMEALVASLRQEYYRSTSRLIREEREVLPCYAAITSAHVMPNAEVWACCVLGESLGNLNDVGFDFPTLWYGAQARAIRARIKRDQCHCPLANQGYMNVLVDPASLVRAGARAAVQLGRARVGAGEQPPHARG